VLCCLAGVVVAAGCEPAYVDSVDTEGTDGLLPDGGAGLGGETGVPRRCTVLGRI
jgi:hypothetical protein